jgi:hypothetical protein
MWFSGIAKYEGGLAHYNIIQEKEGLYHAILIKYDGRPDHIPPGNIILVRGVWHWSGSINNQSLLDELGSVIDKRVKGRMYWQLQQKASPNNEK